MEVAVAGSSPRAATCSAPSWRLSSASSPRYCGARHCVGVGSGLSAIELALRAAGIGPGDEVIVPAYTWVATWLAVTRAGAPPVGVDVARGAPATSTRGRSRAAITARTAAIVPVHLRGEPADMEAIGDDRRGARPARRRGRRAGARRAVRAAPRRHARRRRGVLLLSDQEPRRARRRRCGRRPTTTRWPRACGCCATTACTIATSSRPRAPTRAWRRSRPRCCGRSCRGWTSGTGEGRAGRVYLRAFGGGEEIAVPRPRPGGAGLAPVRDRPRDRDACRERVGAAGDRDPRPLPGAAAPLARLRRRGLARGELPGGGAARRRPLSLPLHPQLGAALRAGRRRGLRATRCATRAARSSIARMAARRRR